ncbi:hypothetical protein AB4225_26865 [Streptomyces sp. 2RAF24]|uniref:hypothetical protein n=1 Tax=Streptomyces sp. 2RAF24 TaxID=3232997 RepID=UPI003F9D50EB
MISEPELVGGTEFPAALEPLPAEPKRRGPPRPWLWALGGAVAASAVWTGGLVAYDRHEDGRGPDLKGYKPGIDPCARAKVDGLASAFGRRGETTNPITVEQPALYRAECMVPLEGKPVSYEVRVTYTVHRVTDPGPEFEALMNDPLEGGGERVSGVGEIAQFTDDGGGTMSLRVLDGQTVIELSLSPNLMYDGTGPPPEPPALDPAATRTFLVEDMTALMAELKA